MSIFEGGKHCEWTIRTIFIGADTIATNVSRLGRTPEEVVRKFESLLGRMVTVIGPQPQPIGHIDMVLTPLGNRTVVLADPAKGASIAGAQLHSDPSAVEEFERSCEREFFGTDRIRELKDRDGNLVERPTVVGGNRESCGR